MRGEDGGAIAVSNALDIRLQILVSNDRNLGFESVTIGSSVEMKPLQILCVGVSAQYLVQNPLLYRVWVLGHLVYELQRLSVLLTGWRSKRG